MSNLRLLLCGAVVLLSLAAPATAQGEWHDFYDGTLGPGNTAWTQYWQDRYSRLMDWTPASKCVKSAYGDDFEVEYYIIIDCDGWIYDERDSGQAIGAYCKNTPGSPSISIICYTCINTPGACP
jgi:hypothetical protein